MFASQSDIEQEERRSSRDAQQRRKMKSPSSSSPSSSSPSSRSSSDHSRPLLTSQHSTYDTNAAASDESAAKRTVQIRAGEFVWNEDDRQTLRERYSSSLPYRLYSTLFRHTSLTRAHLYGTNALKSTRYTLLSFLPVNLFEQLAPWLKPANFYFLCIAVLQAFPSISTTQGRPSILLPLLIVIIISAVKDALEDYGRWRGDWQKNNERYKTYHRGHFHLAHSKDLLVGDVIMIEDGQRVPADCILLVSGVGGGSIVYVDTKNLDGETNLKPKQVPTSMLRLFREDWKSVGHMDVRVVVDAPNGDMRSFAGEIKAEGGGDAKSKARTPKSARGTGGGGSGGGEGGAKQGGRGGGGDDTEPLTLDHLVMSDCLIRNSPWMIGLLIYSGEDTKIRQNMRAQLTETRRKETRVFSMTKRVFLLMVVVQVFMCLIAAALAGWYESGDLGAAWYLYSQTLDTVFLYAGLRFLTWFIIVKDFIPISLYVSLELVQFLQALFMQWDARMRVTLNGVPLSTRVNSSNLNEELAQVHFIFSDKTGTLTENSMVFKKCVIGGERYGKGVTEAGLIRQAKEEGRDVKKAIAEFTEEKRKAREEDEEKAKAGGGKSEREKHVEFDEMDEIRELLKQSKREVGETKEKPKKKGEGGGGKDDDAKAKEGGGGGGGDPTQKKPGKGEGEERSGEGDGGGGEKGKEKGKANGQRESRPTKATSDGDEQSEEQRGGGGGSGEKKKVTIKAPKGDDEDDDEDDEDTPGADGEQHTDTPTAKAGKTSDQSNGSAKGKKESTPPPSKSSSSPSSSSHSPRKGGKKGSQAHKSGGKKEGQGHQKSDEEQAELVRDFLYCLALNNSVFPKVRDDEEVGLDQEEGKADDDSLNDDRSLMEVVVNPVVEAFGTAGETISNAATDAVDVVTSTLGSGGGGGGGAP